MDLLERYQRINGLSARRLVFRIGHEAGLYSDYNNMVLAILFCLRHGIRFEMFSKDSRMLGPRGWSTFFESFCAESHDAGHKYFNHRFPQRRESGLRGPLYSCAKWAFKKATGTDYLTGDLWTGVRAQRSDPSTIRIPDLQIDGTLREACGIIVQMTYRLNEETRAATSHMMKGLALPARFAGIHVRAGDKRTEFALHHPDEYMARLRKVTSLRDVFVLTDDYAAFVHLVRSNPDFTFRTLCGAGESGYDLGRFVQSRPEEKRQQLLGLLASIDILRRAEVFIGTFSANPGAFLGMIMAPARVHGLDGPEWRID